MQILQFPEFSRWRIDVFIYVKTKGKNHQVSNPPDPNNISLLIGPLKIQKKNNFSLFVYYSKVAYALLSLSTDISCFSDIIFIN